MKKVKVKKKTDNTLIVLLLMLFVLFAALIGISISVMLKTHEKTLVGGGTEILSCDEVIGDKTLDKKISLADVKIDDFAVAFDKSTETFYFSSNDGQIHGEKISYIGDSDVSICFNGETETKIVATTEKETYKEFGLIITKLPILNINTRSEIKDRKTDINMNLTLQSSEQNLYDTGTIRYRGGIAYYFYKKPYKIELKNKVSLLGMRKDDDWVLYPGYNDQEKIRNVFSSKLWYDCCRENNEFGLDNGYYYRYVEVVLNGKYHGLFALGYKPDKKMLKTSETEYIFKSGNWSFPKADDPVTDSPIGGYEIKSKNGSAKAWRTFRQWIHDFKNGSATEIKESIDYDNMIDNYLFVNAIQGRDNTGKNNYFTMKKSGNGYKTMLTPWDFDLSFGNDWLDEKVNVHTRMYSMKTSHNIFQRVNPVHRLITELKDEETISKLNARYKELRAGAWSDENLERIIDEYEKDIYGSGAFAREKERWPDGNYNDEAEGLSRFKEFVLERFKYLDEYYK